MNKLKYIILILLAQPCVKLMGCLNSWNFLMEKNKDL